MEALEQFDSTDKVLFNVRAVKWSRTADLTVTGIQPSCSNELQGITLRGITLQGVLELQQELARVAAVLAK